MNFRGCIGPYEVDAAFQQNTVPGPMLKEKEDQAQGVGDLGA